jgi:hypothetical protein
MENIGSELCNQFHIRAKSVLGGKVHAKIADSVWHEVSIRIWRPISVKLNNQQGQYALIGVEHNLKV